MNFRMVNSKLAGLATALGLGLLAGPAAALNVTVGGNTYNIQFFDDADTWIGNQATLNNTTGLQPWYNSAADASAWRDAYIAADWADDGAYSWNSNGSFDDEYIGFAYIESGSNVLAYYALDGNTSSPTTIDNAPYSKNTSGIHWAYATTATPISTNAPEIDANALVKALFALFALGTWLIASRGSNNVA